MVWPLLGLGAAALGSGLASAFGSASASAKQAAAARAALAQQLALYNDMRRKIDPYIDGTQYNADYSRAAFLDALEGYAGDVAGYGQYIQPTLQGGRQASDQMLQLLSGRGGMTEAAKFQLARGVDAIDQSAAARGMLNSGKTLKAVQEHGQNIGTQDFARQIEQLAGIQQRANQAGLTALQAQTGGLGLLANDASVQTAYRNQLLGQLAALAGGQANLGAQTYANLGNAQAAGAMGVANAVSQGFGNIGTIAMYDYMKGADVDPTLPGEGPAGQPSAVLGFYD